MQFHLSDEAEEDIIIISEAGVRLFGEAQALHYHDQLFKLFQLIAENPHMARERKEIFPPVRVHPYKAHLIFYEIDKNGDVLIIRVSHGHEDWANLAN